MVHAFRGPSLASTAAAALFVSLLGVIPSLASALVLVGGVDTPGSADDVEVAGPLAFVADYGGGLRIIDISNPADPLEISALEDITPARDVEVEGELVFVVTGMFSPGALHIVDISDPAAPVEIATFETLGAAVGLAVVDGLAYVAANNTGLRIIDVSTPTAPVEIGSIDTPGAARDVDVLDGVAYLADGRTGGLRIIDVSDPTMPIELGAFDSPGYAEEIAVVGGVAYLADYEAGLRIVDVSNAGSPFEVGVYDLPDNGQINDVEVADGLAFTAGREHYGLQVLDVRDPTAPLESGGLNTPGDALDVEVRGEFAFLASREAGLQIISISDPSVPREVGAVATAVGNLALEGERLYHAGDYAFRVFDISNPEAPLEVGAFTGLDGPRDLKVANGIAYIADSSSGLRIIDATIAAVPRELGRLDTPGRRLGRIGRRIVRLRR